MAKYDIYNYLGEIESSGISTEQLESLQEAGDWNLFQFDENIFEGWKEIAEENNDIENWKVFKLVEPDDEIDVDNFLDIDDDILE